MMYRKLKRVWSHGYGNYIPNFDKVFPELRKLSPEEMCDRFIELDLDFYKEELTPVSVWLRLTMPFAVITMLLMIIGLPFTFLITGNWSYNLGDKNRILNWLRLCGCSSLNAI
ncbi:MAG: hypothetical protein ACOYMF_05690 [Bacteroidales bacterium]